MSESKKVHLASPKGGRSACRYSSRPSRKVRFLSLDEFVKTPDTSKCAECALKAVTPPKPVPLRPGFEEWKKRYGKTDDFLTGDVWEVAKAAWSAAQPKPTPQKYEHELENLKVELEVLKQKHELELQEITSKYRNLQDFCAGLAVKPNRR